MEAGFVLARHSVSFRFIVGYRKLANCLAHLLAAFATQKVTPPTIVIRLGNVIFGVADCTR